MKPIVTECPYSNIYNIICILAPQGAVLGVIHLPRPHEYLNGLYKLTVPANGAICRCEDEDGEIRNHTEMTFWLEIHQIDSVCVTHPRYMYISKQEFRYLKEVFNNVREVV